MNTEKTLTNRKETQESTKQKSELKNTKIELKNTLEGFNSRQDEVQIQISELEDKVMKLTQTEHQKEKKILKMKIRDLWDSITWNNICIIWVLEEEKKKRSENLTE